MLNIFHFQNYYIHSQVLREKEEALLNANLHLQIHFVPSQFNLS